jgi:hypothetical protein
MPKTNIASPDDIETIRIPILSTLGGPSRGADLRYRPYDQ